MTCGRLAAQDAAASFNRANQAYALYESERDKGTNSDAMYSRLIESYNGFVKVVEAPDNSQYITGAKNRLRAMYPQLINGAVYYSGQKQAAKGLELAQAYIEMPSLSVFRGEMLTKDSRYASVLFYAAQASYSLQKFAQAQRYFEEYLNLNAGNELQEKDAYVYLNMIWGAQKNYVQQEAVLEKANARFPQNLDFLYNLVNVHIATNNMEKLVAAIDRILAIDPNNVKVLPIKARLMERMGKNMEALDVYKRLYALNPNSFELMTGVARANFNVATEIVNSGLTIANDADYALVRQRAMPYLYDAQDLFIKILQQEPTSKIYMQGLAGVYQYMDMTAEYEVLSGIVADGASYELFPSRLQAYQATHKNDNITPVGGAADEEPVPVPVDPARLIINVEQFADANNNSIIDAGEAFSVRFTISNTGKGDAYNVRIRLSEQQGFDTYFEGPRELDGGHIPAGTSKEFTFNYLAKTDLPTTDARINIYAFEANGFDADPAEIDVATEEFAMPRLEMADYLFTAEEGTTIKLGGSGKLTMAVQNAGRVTARNVRLRFTLPSNIFPTADSEISIDSIPPGEWVPVNYGFMVNNRYASDSIAIMVSASESTRQSFINETYKVKMGEYLAQTQVTGVSKSSGRTETQTSPKVQLTLDSELLKNVPVGAVNPHRYALVIGNEDYSRPGAGSEINVPYAVNDATVFKEYCIRTFGVPDAQVRMVPNATTGLMHESLQWLVGMASTDPEAELIFYYSGHGNNDEATKEPYLLPVDLTGKNIRLGIALSDLYTQLATYPIKGAYVFLDACFSGGYKSAQPLIAQKGVRVVPKSTMPQGHTLSFSSSSGDQTSSVYHEKKQGYYTYFLIKTIQDAGGNISMKDLFEQTNAAVKRATAKIGKMQEPQCMASPTWSGWEDIHLKTADAASY